MYRMWFPINRRHQGLATEVADDIAQETLDGFQSIGVTKDWRQVLGCPDDGYREDGFPINRRHQGLATSL